MDIDRISDILQQNYNLNAQHIELFREGGNLAYAVTTEARSYFLKIVRPPVHCECVISSRYSAVPDEKPVSGHSDHSNKAWYRVR